jgi:hypothetical protein
MENNNINLLDLGDDILNIIGDYVKKDNIERISNEKLKQDILKYVDMKMKIEKEKARTTKKSILNKIDTRCFFIWTCFTEFCRNHFGDEYLKDDDNFNKIHKIFSEC